MNDYKNTPSKIDELIDSVSTIQAVNAPPFFKDKVLQRLSKKPIEDTQPITLSWFSPKLQLAALLVFAFINIGALFLYTSSTENEDIQTFAESYGFSSSDQSILN